MNILVCVKQVPDTTEIKIDPVTNTLIRAGVPSIVNPFDAYALEVAVRLKESAGGRVIVVSMGPEQAKNALKECLSVGADQAFIWSADVNLAVRIPWLPAMFYPVQSVRWKKKKALPSI